MRFVKLCGKLKLSCMNLQHHKGLENSVFPFFFGNVRWEVGGLVLDFPTETIIISCELEFCFLLFRFVELFIKVTSPNISCNFLFELFCRRKGFI